MVTRVAREPSQLTETAVERHVVRRGIAAVGLVSIALVHLLDVPDKFDELPYIGVLFVGLIITSLLLAEGMIRTDDLRVWLVAGVVSAATIVGYAISRTSGLPATKATTSATGLNHWASPHCSSRASSCCSSSADSRTAAAEV